MPTFGRMAALEGSGDIHQAAAPSLWWTAEPGEAEIEELLSRSTVTLSGLRQRMISIF